MAEKILSWNIDGKPYYQSDFDIKWKNTPDVDLVKQHGEYKSRFQQGAYSSGSRIAVLTNRMPQNFNITKYKAIDSTIHTAFHNAKALEKELANRKIDFKPIELKIPVRENVSKFKTKTNIIKTLLSNVKKLGPALKNIKGLSVLGPLTGLGYAADILGPTNIMDFKDAKITPSEKTTPQTERFREGGIADINYLTRRL